MAITITIGNPMQIITRGKDHTLSFKVTNNAKEKRVLLMKLDAPTVNLRLKEALTTVDAGKDWNNSVVVHVDESTQPRDVILAVSATSLTTGENEVVSFTLRIV